MSRDKRYQRLLNSKRWLEVKAIVWKRANGLCEECKKKSIVTGSLHGQLDCHHVVPVESAKTLADMERLCYDPNNIRLLCVACHKEAHHQLKSQTKQAHIETDANRTASWLDRHIKHDESTD